MLKVMKDGKAGAFWQMGKEGGQGKPTAGNHTLNPREDMARDATRLETLIGVLPALKKIKMIKKRKTQKTSICPLMSCPLPHRCAVSCW